MAKRVLIISPTPTHPQNAGNRARVYSLAASLKQMAHEVYFVHVNREHGDEKAMKEFWGEGYFSFGYKSPKGLRWKVYRKLGSILNKEAVFIRRIDEWYDNGLDEFLSILSRNIAFDAVIVEYVFFSKALECFDKHVIKIIDTHDVFTNRHRAYLKQGQKPTWFSTSARQEAKGLNRADVVIAIHKREREFFAKLTNKRIIIVGHIIPLHEPRKSTPKMGKFLFVGSANPINLKSLRYFIVEIWPKVRSHLKHSKLLIAGKVSDLIEDAEGLVRLGELATLDSAYEMADVVINPALFGTGLKIKTIEALGWAKPVVTNSVGSEGLEHGIGKAFLVADSPEDFADSLIKVLQDEKLSFSLSRESYEFARDWNQKNLNELENLLS